MDRDVTVRFYELMADDGAVVDPVAAINRIAAIPNKRERERDVGEGLRLRLEELNEDAGLVFGDITRVQTENLPGHVTDHDNDPLPVEEIGHYAAFCFEPETRYMALQFDQKIGIGRVCQYLSQFAGGDQFSHLPVLREGTLERFEREHPTEISVRISGIRDFRGMDREHEDYEDQLDQYANYFGAANIKVTVSTRTNQGGLSLEPARRAIRSFLRRSQEEGDVRALTARTVESDEAYNFIRHLLKEKTTLELERNNPATNRERRVAYVKSCYEGHRAYLRRIAGLG